MMYMHHDLHCACTVLRKASRAVTRLYDEALEGSAMTIAQFALLRNIARAEPVELSRLADAMVLDRTSLYRALAPLERAGWVAVTAAGRGRAKRAALTEAGRTAMADTEPAWEAAQRRLVERFGAADWDALYDSLLGLAALAKEPAR